MVSSAEKGKYQGWMGRFTWPWGIRECFLEELVSESSLEGHTGVVQVDKLGKAEGGQHVKRLEFNYLGSSHILSAG